MRSVLVCGHVRVMNNAQALTLPFFRRRACIPHFSRPFGSSVIVNGVIMTMYSPDMSTQTRSTLEACFTRFALVLCAFFRMTSANVIVQRSFSAVAFFGRLFMRAARYRAFEPMLHPLF